MGPLPCCLWDVMGSLSCCLWDVMGSLPCCLWVSCVDVMGSKPCCLWGVGILLLLALSYCRDCKNNKYTGKGEFFLVNYKPACEYDCLGTTGTVLPSFFMSVSILICTGMMLQMSTGWSEEESKQNTANFEIRYSTD